MKARWLSSISALDLSRQATRAKTYPVLSFPRPSVRKKVSWLKTTQEPKEIPSQIRLFLKSLVWMLMLTEMTMNLFIPFREVSFRIGIVWEICYLTFSTQSCSVTLNTPLFSWLIAPWAAKRINSISHRSCSTSSVSELSPCRIRPFYPYSPMVQPRVWLLKVEKEWPIQCQYLKDMLCLTRCSRLR